MQLIPAIDLRAGRCVRPVAGRLHRRDPLRRPDPGQLCARAYRAARRRLAACGRPGRRPGRRAPPTREVIAALAAPRHAAAAGRGRRALARQAIRELLDAGVSRVVHRQRRPRVPRGSGRLAQLTFGAQRLCLAFDVRGARPGTRAARAHAWLDRAPSGPQPCGRRSGPLPFVAVSRHVPVHRHSGATAPLNRSQTLDLYRTALARFSPSIWRWQASGGVRGRRRSRRPGI